MLNKSKIKSAHYILSSLFSIGCALIIVALLWGALSFNLFSIAWRLSRTNLLITGCSILALTIVMSRLWRSNSFELLPTTFSLFIPFLVLSSYLANSQNYFQNSHARYILFGLFLISFVFVKKHKSLWLLTLTAAILAGIAGFFLESDGRLLFNDDHSAFLYRLAQLKSEFPFIPFYNPDWNGGVEAREFFPSGILNLFLLSMPLLYFFDTVTIYNWLIVILLFIIVPLTSIFSTRIARAEEPAPVITGLLSIGASWVWYRWGLSYGTLGFLTSAALVPLNLSLIGRIIEDPLKFPTKLLVLFTLTFSLTLLWPLGILMLAPAVIAVILKLRTVLADKRFLICFSLLFIFHIPWMIVFMEASQVATFVGLYEVPQTAESTNTHIQGQENDLQQLWNPENLLKEIRKNVEAVNPAILLLFLPGIWLFGNRAFRWTFIASLIWMFTLALLAAPLIPQLELHRFYLVLWLLLAQPAALTITSLANSTTGNRKQIVARIAFALTGAVLLYTPVLLYLITTNKTEIRFHFADETLTELSKAINNYGGDGRVLFAGFILHEMAHGHVAPLPLFVDKPLIASSYQHSFWQYTDVIPDHYRARKDKGVEEYLNLYNVSSIVTHERFWRRWFTKRSRKYQPVWKYKNFTLFQRIDHQSNYFLTGNGSITQASQNRVVLLPKSPEAVIKFNYFNFLEAKGCDLSEYALKGNINLIRISNCNIGKEVVIQSVKPWRRFLDIFNG